MRYFGADGYDQIHVDGVVKFAVTGKLLPERIDDADDAEAGAFEVGTDQGG